MNTTEKSKNGVDPCPRCVHPESPPEIRFCERCSAPLQRPPARRSKELALRARERGVTLKERFLAGRLLGPVAKKVTADLAIVAVDLGLAWLRHRLEKTDPPTLPRDAAGAWQEARPSGSEYVHGYYLKEAALLIREGRENRHFYSSELTITSRRIEK